MIDVHCHLIDAKYEGRDAQSIINESRATGVEMIVNGTGLENSIQSIVLTEGNTGVWAAVGIHPEEKNNIQNMKYKLGKLAVQAKVVAIGEIGLDYREDTAEEEKIRQKELFKLQLELARDTGLPAIVHNRNANEDVEKMILKYQMKTLLHCFSGSGEFMMKMAELGCYFSFGGMITYKKNESLRDLVRIVPADRLLLETDSPYLPPEPVRGTINTPVNVKIVAERMAVIRGVSVEEIEKQTSDNARRLFSKMK
jgi:TatD DNase family protein